MTEPDTTGTQEEPEGPYRFGALMVASWRFYTARFAPLVLIFFIIDLLFIAMTLVSLIDLSERTELWISNLVAVIQTIGFSLAFGLVAVILEKYLVDEYIGIRKAIREMGPGIKGAFSCALISVILAQGVGSFFPPLQFLFIGPPMLIQIAVIERKQRLTDVWGRSKVLMAGHWARVLSYLMTLSLGMYLLITVIGVSVSEAAGGFATTTEILLFQIFILILAVVIFPFIAAAQYVAYADVAALEGTFQPPQRNRNQRTPRTPRGRQPEVIEAEVVRSETPQQPDRELTHYDTLGVRTTATQKQIRRSYETRKRLLDPERHADAPEESRNEMAGSLARAEEAYRVLSDPELRDEYNNSLR